MKFILSAMGVLVVLAMLSPQPLAEGRGQNHVMIYMENNQMSADPNSLTVVGRSVNISFEIGTKGWSFPATGSFGINIPGNDGQFRNWTRARDTIVRVLDKNSNKRDYKYNITVCKDRRCISLDRVIRNNN